jgi:hypothetical protein
MMNGLGINGFFLQGDRYTHPYTIRPSAMSAHNNYSFLVTLDGVKMRLYDFHRAPFLMEADLRNANLTHCIVAHHPLYPSRVIFVIAEITAAFARGTTPSPRSRHSPNHGCVPTIVRGLPYATYQQQY